MYLSRMTINPMANAKKLAEIFNHDTYREHQALWKLFATDPDASRDFLYRRSLEHGRVKYYVLSKRKPNDAAGIWLIDPPKLFEPKLKNGQQLGFSLRANPIVTTKNPQGKPQRHDVVMHEKQKIGFSQMPADKRPPLQCLIQSSCTNWLLRRARTSGFEIVKDQVSVEGYQQHRSLSKNGETPIRYSSVEFQGLLTVRDAEAFTQMLYNGLGKAKAFGCGLMLVRRIAQ